MRDLPKFAVHTIMPKHVRLNDVYLTIEIFI